MVVALVVGVLAASLVRGTLLASYHVPSAQPVPTLEPGDRVLVLTIDRSAGDDAVVLVDDGAAGHSLVPASRADGDVVGTVLLRWWPLSRAGAVTAGSAA